MTNTEMRCPFFRTDSAVCTASLRSRIPPAQERASCCAGEGHEDCPTFLARLLAFFVRRR